MSDEFLFPVILVVAGVGSAILVGISVLALFRRQSLPYFLVTLAIGTFLLRTFLGAVMLGGMLSSHMHHLIEHLLDAVAMGLLFMAVYTARRSGSEPRNTAPYREYDD